MSGNLPFINHLATLTASGVDILERTAEGIRLLVNLAQQVIFFFFFFFTFYAGVTIESYLLPIQAQYSGNDY